MPVAPICANRLLAKEVPTHRDTSEPIRAATGRTGKLKRALGRGCGGAKPAPLRGMGGAMIAPHTILGWSALAALAVQGSVLFDDFRGDSMFISSAFAQTAPAAAAGGDMQSTLMSMLPLLLMFAVLYFVMIRPQMKKQKEHRAMVDALAKGDEIVTAGGLLGKVSKIGDAYLSVELASGVEVQMQRQAVVQVLPKGTLK